MNVRATSRRSPSTKVRQTRQRLERNGSEGRSPSLLDTAVLQWAGIGTFLLARSGGGRTVGTGGLDDLFRRRGDDFPANAGLEEQVVHVPVQLVDPLSHFLLRRLPAGLGHSAASQQDVSHHQGLVED